MKYAFTEIFDIPKLTELCESFTRINGTVTALLDLDGNVHIKTGWQPICTQFHRLNEKSAARCLESDTAIANKLAQGEKYNVYQCKNGLVDVAVPIYVGNQHVANFFTGQFLFQPADHSYFHQQAKELGVEIIPYMDALKKVPVFSEDEIKRIMTFLVALAQTIGEMGKARLDLLRLSEAERVQNAALKRKTSELKVAKQALEKLASEDALTGLCNRRYFDKTLSQEILRARRYQHSLVLCLFDVDKFKVINDTYGHGIGDAVLQHISTIVLNSLRKTDTVSRIGGDEFSILFPETENEHIEALLQSICNKIANTQIEINGYQIRVSCSFGTASSEGGNLSERELMERADRALYGAKSEGRNQVMHFSSLLQTTSLLS
ncbi:PocR ligand-binding domain-containing protein [Alteromonas lipolytica]|uniref:diguanylate cyclase n=1 Tax=Alteromonas lipolytica TaxID=1856405 RepID=A0A1E8FFF9_9ALTE|nr:diguanylate cyclase [Alteromonas lipolytica]OFI34664.1 hypothetical protein BFC17_13840 [Alteromonas lipolytica]